MPFDAPNKLRLTQTLASVSTGPGLGRVRPSSAFALCVLGVSAVNSQSQHLTESPFSKSRGITKIRVGLSNPTDLPGQNQPNGIKELPGASAN